MDNRNDFDIEDFLKNFDQTLNSEMKDKGNQTAKKTETPKKNNSSDFNVKIDHSKDFVDDEEGYMPAYNGEIYFANHKPLHKEEEPAPQPQQKQKQRPQQNIRETAKNRTKSMPIHIAPPKVMEENIRKAGKKANSIAKKTGAKKIARKLGKKATVIISVCLVISLVLSLISISCLNDVLAINRDSEKVITVTIPTGSTTSSIIKLLDKEGLVKNRIFCNIIAKIQGFRSDNYIPGVYYVTASMGVEGMLLHFKTTQTTGETVRLTFPEGYSVDQIIEKLEKYEVCSAASIKQTMAEVDFSAEYDFLKKIDDKDLRYHYLEGYLYPDTYDFYVGENAGSVIRKFLNNFQDKWTDEYQAQADKMGMSIDDAVTIASIIQKEAYGADQMPLISSVIHNRLNNNALYPTLQCDSTTVYITDYIEKNVTDKTLVASLTDRYSTKRCIGLPIGAICNPGNDAIKAALFPTQTKYYFFLHDKNYKLYLAANDSEQQKNAYKASQAS